MKKPENHADHKHCFFILVSITIQCAIMPTRRRSPVQRYHDRVAGKYDQMYDDAFWRWHDALTWDYLKPHLPRDANAKIVDLGCGSGKWTARFARSGYRVTGVDISAKMLDQAKKKIAEQGHQQKAEFLLADIGDLSAIPAKEYALAVALGDPIGCTRSPVVALRQIRRILIDDGILVASFDNRLAAIDYFLDRGDAAALRQFLSNGKTHWLTRDIGERFEIVTFAPSDLKRLLSTAGFEVIELIGKTVLPLRHFRDLIATPASRRTWARIEKSLSRDPSAVGRASHIQVTSRVRRGSPEFRDVAAPSPGR